MHASEERRNRVLRRADWRFLLGTPDPELSVVYTDGALAEAVRAVSRRVVDGRLTSPDASCDLAVAVDPDLATLRAAWTALRPGGACYTEWTSRVGTGPAVARRRLAAAGFTDVSFYTPRPAPDRGLPEAWIPLGASRAAKWYMGRRRMQAGARHMVGRAARRLGWQVASWLPVVTPICAVARKRRSARSAGPHLEARTSDFQQDVARASVERVSDACRRSRGTRIPWVVLTPGARSVNKVILLRLSRDGRAELVVKVPRTAEAAIAIEREAAVLEEVRAIHGDIPGIPRVVFSGIHAGVQVIGETPVHGSPLSQLARTVDYRALAVKAAEWQARLVHPCGRQSRWASSARHIESVLEYLEYLDQLDAAPRPVAHAALIRATRAALATIGPMPLACEQRDFSPWNVFLTPTGELAVLDWESAEPFGLPALDLIYFLTHLAVYREAAWTPDRVREVHRSTLDPSTEFGRVTTACLAYYAQLVGMDPAAIPALRILCWLVHSQSEYSRRAEAGGTTADPAGLRDSLFLTLWRQELEVAWSAAA